MKEILRSPKSGGGGIDETTSTEFFKRYGCIQVGREKPFAQRMDFDIYRRATKDARLDCVRSAFRPTIDSREADCLIDRLQTDTTRRRKAKKYIEETRDAPPAGKVRMSKQAGNAFYRRMMEAQKDREQLLEAKRKISRELKEQEDEAAIQASRPHRGYNERRHTWVGPLNHEEVEGMVNRLDLFGKMVRAKAQARRREEKEREDEEVCCERNTSG